MTHAEALQKVAKLLRLSKSSNPNEAALAASRAQEIIDRFKIEAAAISLDGASEPDEPIKDFGDDPLEYLGARKTYWKSRLALALARYNGCKMYNGDKGPAVIGRPSDVATVRYLYAWLRQEVDRLAARDCKGTWANNYRNGVIDTIGSRLFEQKKQTEAAIRKEVQQLEQSAEFNKLALIRVNNAIAKVEQQAAKVEEWQKQHVPLPGTNAIRKVR